MHICTVKPEIVGRSLKTKSRGVRESSVSFKRKLYYLRETTGWTSAWFKQKFLFHEGRRIADGWLGKHSWHTWAMPRAGHSPGLRGDIVFEFVWVRVRQRGFSKAIPLPSEASSPSSPPLGPWGSLQSAEPCLTETQPPYKSHPPIYLMCSSTRKPSICPRGARISKHSNSLGVQISSGPKLYSQIHNSL